MFIIKLNKTRVTLIIFTVIVNIVTSLVMVSFFLAQPGHIEYQNFWPYMLYFRFS